MKEPKKKVLLLSAEGIGHGNNILGYEILVALLDTLPKRDDLPFAIVCWNTAVRLLAEDSPLLPQFKRLEEKGVKILAGQLCVKELGLTGKITVGKSATMGEILDLLLHNDVINL